VLTLSLWLDTIGTSQATHGKREHHKQAGSEVQKPSMNQKNATRLTVMNNEETARAI